MFNQLFLSNLYLVENCSLKFMHIGRYHLALESVGSNPAVGMVVFVISFRSRCSYPFSKKKVNHNTSNQSIFFKIDWIDFFPSFSRSSVLHLLFNCKIYILLLATILPLLKCWQDTKKLYNLSISYCTLLGKINFSPFWNSSQYLFYWFKNMFLFQLYYAVS